MKSIKYIIICLSLAWTTTVFNTANTFAQEQQDINEQSTAGEEVPSDDLTEEPLAEDNGN